MNHEILFDAITNIRSDLVEQAGQEHKSRPGWIGGVAVMLCVAVLGGAILLTAGNGGPVSVYAAYEAVYPEMASYPNEMEFIDKDGYFDDEGFTAVKDTWLTDVMHQKRDPACASGLGPFWNATAGRFLADTNGENRAFSPLNLYMALSMLAEITDGTSRRQIMDLLGSDSIESLRSQANDVWNGSYRCDGAVSSVLSCSLWLDSGTEYKDDTLKMLAEHYYASSYYGDMGSQEVNQALQEWLSSQTGGILDDQVSGISLNPETVLALVTTIYFQSKWTNEFSEAQTHQGVFHSPTGKKNCAFMHQDSTDCYYWADRFGAVARPLESGGNMWFLLPDEGLCVDDLLEDPQTMDFILKNGKWDNQEYLIVHQSVPKFDISSSLNLEDHLKELGITQVFDQMNADFSPVTPNAEGIFLSQAQQDLRIQIDEEGCSAAAYTVMASAGAGRPPEKEIDFTLDRPFLFAVTNQMGLPMFVGVVNQPA